MKEFEAIKQDEKFIEIYTRGMSLLQQSGIFNVLRQLGNCRFSWSQDMEAVALRGAWSSGWQEAIDTLFNFREILEATKTVSGSVKADFGGLDFAVAKGHLTKEEADAIRRGEPFKFPEPNGSSVSKT